MCTCRKLNIVPGCTINWYVCMQEKLGLILEKEDEMECLVGGCNFLLKAIRHEAFTYENGALNFVTNTGKCLSHDWSVLKHLHNGKTRFDCPQTFSYLDSSQFKKTFCHWSVLCWPTAAAHLHALQTCMCFWLSLPCHCCCGYLLLSLLLLLLCCFALQVCTHCISIADFGRWSCQ